MTVEAHLPYAALYYPYATFGDERWLKESLLAWDRVALIRPAGAEADLSLIGPIERAILREEPGFIDPRTPDDHVLYTLHEVFESSPPSSWQQLRERYGPERRAGLSRPARTTRQAAPSNADPRLTWIFADERNGKMSHLLSYRLQEEGLAETYEGNMGGLWLGLHPRFAAIYMTALAGQLARHAGLVAVTDDAGTHRVAGALDLAQLDAQLIGRRGQRPPAATVEEAEVVYLNVALNASPHPVDLDTVPVEKLLEFRAGHMQELERFRDHLTSLGPRLAGMGSITSQRDLEEALLELYRAKTQPAVDQLRESMSRSGLTTVLRALTLKFDVTGAATALPGMAAGAIATAAGAPPEAGLLPVAVALAAVPLIGANRQLRREARESPVAFLLAAEREMSPQALLNQSI